MTDWDKRELINFPNRLEDVARPCTQIYWPEWNSRGIRPVRCTRPARWVVTTPYGTAADTCGIHARGYFHKARIEDD